MNARQKKKYIKYKILNLKPDDIIFAKVPTQMVNRLNYDKIKDHIQRIAGKEVPLILLPDTMDFSNVSCVSFDHLKKIS